jgi:deoxyhypusine synthase
MNNEKIARENLLRASSEPEGLSVRGYDFSMGVNYKNLMDSFATSGFQATHLSQAIEITNRMIADNSFIFLG